MVNLTDDHNKNNSSMNRFMVDHHRSSMIIDHWNNRSSMISWNNRSSMVVSIYIYVYINLDNLWNILWLKLQGNLWFWYILIIYDNVSSRHFMILISLNDRSSMISLSLSLPIAISRSSAELKARHRLSIYTSKDGAHQRVRKMGLDHLW